MRLRLSPLAFGALLAATANPSQGADSEAGKKIFEKCAVCHTAEAGKNKIGPSLFGVVGRKSASVPNSTIPTR